MIYLKTVQIEEFRGIRKLGLDLEGNSFGICGPNGTGKSGVVDAIEFCLTGDVTRLSGQGSSGLSVRAHAPHVDQNTSPEKANVTISAEIPTLKKTVTLHRSVKTPNKLKITPNDDDVKAVINELETHPEFALSRREIIKYIITPPGKRSEDVQNLLRLDHLEKLRKSFTTSANKLKREADEAKRAYETAQSELRTTLNVDKLDCASILRKTNKKRKLLGHEELTELTKETSFKEGVTTPSPEQPKAKLHKSTSLADLSALQSAIKEGEPIDLVESCKVAQDHLKKLKEDKKALTLARQYALIRTGFDLVTEDACPLCDKVWKAEELREYLRKKLLSAKEIEELVNELCQKIKDVLTSLFQRKQEIERVIEYCQKIDPVLDHTELLAYLNTIRHKKAALNRFLEDHSQVDPTLEAISKSWWAPDAGSQSRIDNCEEAVKALHDISAEEEAREFLAVAQDRYERLLNTAKTSKEIAARSVTAQKVLGHYNDSCTSVLEGIYDQVAQDFSYYYRIINGEDEEKFLSKLASAPAKLSFDVDFYGRGLFPPGAYHSEGHQDGMGLCLYLALMKHTLSSKFTFAVLDDVLMSVDTGHRRQVCRMLRSEFPDTQFILTTHDRVWLQYMKTENLILRSQLFGEWTIDAGPRVWDDQDVWTEINDELDKGNVPKAAWLLRHYLEYTTTVLADNLRARVEFRGDGNYDLGDLLPRVLKAWKERLQDGEKSAVHWQLKDVQKNITEKRAEAKKLIAKANAEQWAVNPSIHYNEWANFDKHEFKEVVEAFKQLLEHLRCEKKNCKSYLYVSPPKGNVEEMRCNCGSTNINLKTRN